MKKNNIGLLVIACLCLTFESMAQQPIPAKQQQKAILLLNGTVHVGNGTVLKNAALAIINGKISYCGEPSKLNYDVTAFEIIDLKGKEVYPGFIAPNTTIGLSEIEMVRSTNDYAEVGSMNANVRALISYNTDSKVTPTVRTNGILIAQTVPHGGTISGQSAVMELDGWNWEDAVLKADDGMHLNWPRMFVQRGWWAEPDDIQKNNTEKEIQKIRSFFSEAKAYGEGNATEKNLRFEAMRGIFKGEKKLFIRCENIKEIQAAIFFGNEFGITPVLVGASDAWMCTELLKENNISIVLNRTHSLPGREDDDIIMPYKLPAILQAAGILYCQSVSGFWQVRNLPFIAGTARAHGLTYEEALSSITWNTAKILGIDQRAGTLEVGKDATLIVSAGDALDMRGNKIEMAFVRGKSIALTNVHTELDKKFRDKYGIK